MTQQIKEIPTIHEFAQEPEKTRKRTWGIFGSKTKAADTPVTKVANSNPAPLKHHPPTSKPLRLPRRIVGYCHAGLEAAGKMTYSEGANRSELFHRSPGDFIGAHADCSQFVASILHWLGVASVTDTDYTGTLLEKGKLVKVPAPGRVAIWGPGTGAHAAFVTEKVGKDWMTVGFGHQGAPDRQTLSAMNSYFEAVGEPGVRFLEFT